MRDSSSLVGKIVGSIVNKWIIAYIIRVIS